MHCKCSVVAQVVKKTNIHRLTEAQKINRQRNSRKLYERYLFGNKYKCMITLAEITFISTTVMVQEKLSTTYQNKNIPDDALIKCHES